MHSFNGALKDGLASPLVQPCMCSICRLRRSQAWVKVYLVAVLLEVIDAGTSGWNSSVMLRCQVVQTNEAFLEQISVCDQRSRFNLACLKTLENSVTWAASRATKPFNCCSDVLMHS